ncbi:MAG: DUF5676 family membrane protein [Pyrinomonadaceae bacterium]
MKIDPLKFGIAGAATAAFVWVICSVLVWLVPGGMMNVTTNMMHMEMGRGGWTISPIGVALGLVGWSLFTGIFAWLMATIYNRLLNN